MARPRTPVGSWGEITTTELANGWEASAYFRDRNGNLPRVKKRGRTKTAATNNLKKQLVSMAKEVRQKTINRETRFDKVCGLWLTYIQGQADSGAMSWSSVKNFRSWTRTWIIPACGQLQLHELSVGVFEDLVDEAQDLRSYSTAAQVKTTLTLICDFVIRHNSTVLHGNYGRQMKRLRNHDPKEVVALDKDEVADLRAKLSQFIETKQNDSRGRVSARRRVWDNLIDSCDGLLSTGVRIGELFALTGEDFDNKEQVLTVNAHLVRKPEAGLIRVSGRKGGQKGLLLRVPEWSVPMWRRRKLAAGGGPLFPSPESGGWQSLTTAGRQLREAFDWAGYPDLTSHVLGRKTVARAMDEAGLDIGDVANQLGNTRKIAEDHYVPARVANPRSAAALEALGR
ncbi:site-specific integrase [Actinosynnema sp. NPDC023587]|uniref:tyrosine-type recombinase/integrase n=1 Tax=Actinosynnema sp. NPDC023587 TaxID=3154695 RepID=UPI0033F2BCDE